MSEYVPWARRTDAGCGHRIAQIDEKLRTDPDNENLKTLRSELVSLADLLREASADGEAARHKSEARAKAAAAHKYHAGDECMARYQADGHWYPAKVTSVTGAAESPVYSVIFLKFKTTEVVTAADLRPQQSHVSQKDAAPRPAWASHSSKRAASRPMSHEERERERERKRARKEKKIERENAKNAEQAAKQSAWQKFAAKGAKKRYGIAGDKSMFKTPDDPYAKVGAGRGMTEQAQRTRHVYEQE